MKSDYRRQFKDWDVKRIENYLPYLKEKLIKNVGICDSNLEYYSKMISYLNNKILKQKL